MTTTGSPTPSPPTAGWWWATGSTRTCGRHCSTPPGRAPPQASDPGARVGRGNATLRTTEVRGDSIQWLEPDDPAPCVGVLLARLEGLRSALNERLYLGLIASEAHFAHYPPGGAYRRHLDRFRDEDARAVSAVIHLGDPWQPRFGGELRIYLEGPDGEVSIDIAPEPGQLVLFLSGEIEHEVLATQRDRYSVACWMRRRTARTLPL
ncbi:MAG: 2OG-Fe(II) oxygenase [Rhodanobacteraceae bacterium]|nr:2OG-Fe(II) oxygenase [Rhodanobacteraceae bacterium]